MIPCEICHKKDAVVRYCVGCTKLYVKTKLIRGLTYMERYHIEAWTAEGPAVEDDNGALHVVPWGQFTLMSQEYIPMKGDVFAWKNESDARAERHSYARVVVTEDEWVGVLRDLDRTTHIWSMTPSVKKIVRFLRFASFQEMRMATETLENFKRKSKLIVDDRIG